MPKPKPYQPRSLAGATREVRMLRKVRDQLRRLLDEYDADRRLMAKLAADGPAFDNPIHVACAKARRDYLLSRQGLNPDGSPRGVA